MLGHSVFPVRPAASAIKVQAGWFAAPIPVVPQLRSKRQEDVGPAVRGPSQHGDVQQDHRVYLLGSGPSDPAMAPLLPPLSATVRR